MKVDHFYTFKRDLGFLGSAFPDAWCADADDAINDNIETQSVWLYLGSTSAQNVQNKCMGSCG